MSRLVDPIQMQTKEESTRERKRSNIEKEEEDKCNVHITEFESGLKANKGAKEGNLETFAQEDLQSNTFMIWQAVVLRRTLVPLSPESETVLLG